MEIFSPVRPRMRVGMVSVAAGARFLFREVIRVVAAAVFRKFRRSMVFRLPNFSVGCNSTTGGVRRTNASAATGMVEILGNWVLSGLTSRAPPSRIKREKGGAPSGIYQFSFIANWNWRG